VHCRSVLNQELHCRSVLNQEVHCRSVLNQEVHCRIGKIQKLSEIYYYLCKLLRTI
jgi:hypothetical protein